MAYGCGIYNAGTLTLSGSTISNNFSGAGFDNPVTEGGGIYNAGTLTVSNSTFNTNWIDGTYIENNIYGPYTDGGGNTFS
jgi:hypothetical protein